MLVDLICRFGTANKNASISVWLDACHITRTLFVRKCSHGTRYCTIHNYQVGAHR